MRSERSSLTPCPPCLSAPAKSGQLTIAQYGELLRARTAQDRSLALALKAANRVPDAMRVMKRIKLMQEELREVGSGG